MFKRIVSLLLVVALSFGMLPLAAMAEETVPAETAETAETLKATEETALSEETEAGTAPGEIGETTAPAETEEAAVPAETEEATLPAETLEAVVPIEPEETVPAAPEETTAPTEETMALCDHARNAGDCAVCEVEALIDGLPTFEAIQVPDEKVNAQIQAAMGAYEALSVEDRALVRNADELIALANAMAEAALTTASDDADIVTRAEWLSRLTDVFEMTVEEDNYPDNYFSDLSSDSEYYYDVLLAVEFGVVNVESGGKVRPDDPATREFAAQTLNFCLGFQFEGDTYSFTDSGICEYPSDDQIAVDRGWLTLIGGAFCPETPVTSAEVTVMINDAKAVLKSASINSEYQSSYVFADHVVVFPYGTDVEIDIHDVVTIYNAETMLAAGQTFVVYPTELPVLYKAKSVSGNTNVMTVTTEEADEASSVVSINAQGVADMDLSQFEAEEGVSAMYIETDADVAAAMDTYGITVSKGSVIAEKEVTLKNGIKVKVVFTIANIDLKHKINLASDYFYLTVIGDTTLTSTVSIDDVKDVIGTSSVTLGTVRVAGIGKVTVSVELALNGKVTLTHTGTFEAGIEKSSSGFRMVKSFEKKNFSCVVEAHASIGLKADFAIDIIAAEANVYVETGIAGDFKSSAYNDGKDPNTCTNITAWLYAEAGASATVGIGSFKKFWSKDFTIYDHTNSPARVSFHYEDHVQVYQCTRGNTYHYTAADSRYGSSSYGAGSSTGTGSNGETYTIFTYSVDGNDNATITAYKGKSAALYVPETLDGYTVTAIGDYAFQNKTSLQVVTLPRTVTSIGKNAFDGCKNLYSINIPTAVTKIGAYAFYNCAKLTSIIIPSGVRTINNYTFFGCEKLTSVSLPDTVTKISANAFHDCSKLYNIQIPSGVTSIGLNAFYNCASLMHVTIPGGVEEVEQYSFHGCTSLTSLTIEYGVKTIDTGAFSGCTSLTEISLPDSLTHIASSFQGCTSLSSVKLPDSITSLGRTFRDCTALRECILPSGLTKISEQLFYRCTSLEIVDIPKTVTVIEDAAFHECKSLANIVIPEGCTSLGFGAFQSCTSLSGIVIPDSVTSIGWSVFKGCTALRTAKLPKNITTISPLLFSGCKMLTSIIIPNGVTYIGANAFQNCKSLTSITFPAALETLMEYCFSGCTGLNTIKFRGDAPSCSYCIFSDVTATAYYPAGNATWTEEAFNQDYNADLTWVSYNPSSDLPVPAKPHNIVNTVSGVHVYWKDVEGVTKYGLWRSETGKNGTYKWLANPTVPHFTDTKVESGKTYHYRVTTLENGLNTHSQRSDSIGITYVATPDLTLRVNRAVGIGLRWNKIVGATGYAIYRKSYSGTDPWARVATISGGDSLSWDDTSVKNRNGEVFRYTIRALAGSNMKTLSGCRNTGRTMVRLTSLTLNSAAKATANSIKSSWSKNPEASGYEVRFMVGSTVYKTVTVGGCNNTVKTINGLKSGNTYKIQVRSYKKVDGVGSFYSAWSTAKTVTLK